MDQARVLLTQAGLDELKLELKQLEEIKRPGLVERLANARDQGDLSENSDYTAAKEELAFVDGRISELKEIIAAARIISPSHSKNNVSLGCTVTVQINRKEEKFMIVGEWEADPKEKKISHSSPLGKALLGKKPGDHAEVEAPAGKIVYKVLHIE